MGALFAFGHGPEELFGGILRMAGHETDQEVPGNVVDHADQIGEVHVQAEVFAVGVDVLAEKRDVFITGGDQLLCFPDDILRQTGALAPAHVGNHAVGAEVVAAVHDGEPGFDAAVALARDALGHDAEILLGGIDALVPVHDPLEKLGKAPELMRTEDQVHNGIGMFDPFGHVLLLHHTAADRNDLVRVGFLGMVQGTDIAEHAHLGMLTHGAGVDDDDIRLKLVLRLSVAHLGEIAAELLAVGLVLLAAVGVHHGEGAGSVRGDPVKNLMTDGKLAGDLLLGDGCSFVFQGPYSVPVFRIRTLFARLRSDNFQRFSILSRKKEKCKRESRLFRDSGGEGKTRAKRTGGAGEGPTKKHRPFRENRL